MDGTRVLGYGTSTKGNVLLQFCAMSEQHLTAIAKVNLGMFGAPKADERAVRSDDVPVLPWHFKDGFVRRAQAFFNHGSKMNFAFPAIKTV